LDWIDLDWTVFLHVLQDMKAKADAEPDTAAGSAKDSKPPAEAKNSTKESKAAKGKAAAQKGQ